MTLNESTLAALKTLTSGGARDLLVLLTPVEGQYDLLSQHITVPIVIVSDQLECDGETTQAGQLRERDYEIKLPCRAGSIEDLVNLSVTLTSLEGIIALGCRAIFVRMASNRGDCIIILRDIIEVSSEGWHSVIAGPVPYRRAVRDVLAIALELGKMRKRSAGAMYIIGDTENVLARSASLFLNPFRGQPREHRDISDPKVRDTLREFARLDGAVIVDAEGFVQAAGVYVNADTRNVNLLIEGARHATAAAITHETEAIAVTVSEKSGTVMVFEAGKAILTVEAWKS